MDLTISPPFSRRVSYLYDWQADSNGLTTFLQSGSLRPSDTSHIICNEEEFKAIPLTAEDLWICFSVKLSTSVLSFHSFLSLKTLTVGRQSLKSISAFELSGLNQLASFIVLDKCFLDGRGNCRIVDCPKLRSIEIGDDSFTNYVGLELKNLPSLESLELGVRCFYSVISFSLSGLTECNSSPHRPPSALCHWHERNCCQLLSFGCIWE